MLCSTTVCYNFKKEFDFSSTLENADYYFKRSFSKEKNKELLGESPFSEKIFPYGFNYFVSHRRIPVPFKDKIYDIIKCAYQMCRFHSADRIVWEAEDFVCPPTPSYSEPKIIFCTRLWDEPGFSKQELEHINSTRIELVRKLKQKYKENFMGGVYKNDPEALNDMKNANYRYYNEYCSPKKLIENALKTAGVNLDSCEKSEFTEEVIR